MPVPVRALSIKLLLQRKISSCMHQVLSEGAKVLPKEPFSDESLQPGYLHLVHIKALGDGLVLFGRSAPFG